MAVHNALVLDTQGSELRILRGGGGDNGVLRRFRYVKLEVPDFEAYRDCGKVDEVTRFMRDHGFVEKHRHPFVWNPLGGIYYDIVYRNQRLTSRWV